MGYEKYLDCETCGEVATVFDEFGNYFCEDCMCKEIDEDGTVPADYSSV
jgi:hypothetical protein